MLHLNFKCNSWRRLTRITLNDVPVVSYALNDDDQRMTTTLPDHSVWNYTYDPLGQLTAANAMSYTYDDIGNRITSIEDTEVAYTANVLNQYTAIGAEEPTYDPDGNMLTWNGWTYTWNNEKRLIAAEKGSVRLEADYDYMGRRFEKKVFTNNTLTQHQRFVYDGYKLIAIYEGDALTHTFVWQPSGLDIPLAMTHAGETYYYIADGNKNILQLRKEDGSIAANYAYAPFGAVLSRSGEMALVNPFRFSSEYHDDETGLVYYNYRYYNPVIGRWTKRDPIEEKGGVNLCGFLINHPTNAYDRNGLIGLTDWVNAAVGCTSGNFWRFVSETGITDFTTKTLACSEIRSTTQRWKGRFDSAGKYLNFDSSDLTACMIRSLLESVDPTKILEIKGAIENSKPPSDLKIVVMSEIHWTCIGKKTVFFGVMPFFLINGHKVTSGKYLKTDVCPGEATSCLVCRDK